MWTFVEHFAVSSLNMRFDGVQATKHHLTAGASTNPNTETNHSSLQSFSILSYFFSLVSVSCFYRNGSIHCAVELGCQTECYVLVRKFFNLQNKGRNR